MAVIGRPSPPSKLNASDIADNAVTSAHIQTDALTHADLAPNSVTNSEMADDAVGIAELSASGTPNATSFLRGDNSWQVVDTEGTGIKSTGESGGTKFLREDGDGTSSWQSAGSPSITDNGNSNAMTIDASENITLVESLTTPSLKQNSNQNLSGTYSAHQLFIADGYTLTGNITVNEDIALTKLSDDGTTINLTTDGTSRTITGTGSIEASTIAQTPVTSVTGMTGELGTAVTGSPTLNLTNATSLSPTAMPTGAVIQVVSKKQIPLDSGVETAWTNTGITMEITPKLASSYIHFMGTLFVAMTNSGGNGGCSFRWRRSQTGQSDVYPEELDDTSSASNYNYASHWNQASWTAAEFNWMHPFQGIDKTVHTAGAQITYTLFRSSYSLNGLVVGGTSYQAASKFICYEIVK